MKEKTVVCARESHMRTLGTRLAGELPSGGFVALYGDLGAGKTILVRGIGEALGTSLVASPTFTIVQEHDTVPRLLHFDAYRLADADELYAIGFEDYLRADALIVMEWADLVAEALPQERLDLTITGSGDQPRSVTLAAHGIRYEELLDRL